MTKGECRKALNEFIPFRKTLTAAVNSAQKIMYFEDGEDEKNIIQCTAVYNKNTYLIEKVTIFTTHNYKTVLYDSYFNVCSLDLVVSGAKKFIKRHKISFEDFRY